MHVQKSLDMSDLYWLTDEQMARLELFPHEPRQPPRG